MNTGIMHIAPRPQNKAYLMLLPTTTTTTKLSFKNYFFKNSEAWWFAGQAKAEWISEVE